MLALTLVGFGASTDEYARGLLVGTGTIDMTVEVFRNCLLVGS